MPPSCNCPPSSTATGTRRLRLGLPASPVHSSTAMERSSGVSLAFFVTWPGYWARAGSAASSPTAARIAGIRIPPLPQEQLRGTDGAPGFVDETPVLYDDICRPPRE